MTNVGIQAQRNSGSELDLLRVRVRDMLAQEGTGSDIVGNLVDLRMTLDQINPDELSKPGRMSIVPFIGEFHRRSRCCRRSLSDTSPYRDRSRPSR